MTRVTTSGVRVWEFESGSHELVVRLASTSRKAAFFPMLVNLAGRKCVVVNRFSCRRQN